MNVRRTLALVVGLLSLTLCVENRAYPQTPIDFGYRDSSYPLGTGNDSNVTAEKPESKLWWNDGYWWASMWSNSGGAYHIFKLDTSSQAWLDTGTELDDRSKSKADVLWDGQRLYAVSHIWEKRAKSASAGDRGKLFRYDYDSATQTYDLDPGFPVEVNQATSEALVLAKDSTGRLWVTYVQDGKVMINHSLDGDDRNWGTPFVLPVGDIANVSNDDLSSISVFDARDGAGCVGVMWSDKGSPKTVYFACHRDGTASTTWQSAAIFTLSSDDHLNLKSLSSDDAGSLFAVVKTSMPSHIVTLLALDAGTSGVGSGQWSSYPVYTGGEGDPTRPQLLIDTSNRELLVFTRLVDESRGAIYLKSSSIDSISFPAGLGTPVIMSSDDTDISNPTSTKQNVNSTTGCVVLASDKDTGHYFHNYTSLGDPPAETTVSFDFPITGGAWYLISLPVIPDDNSLGTLFPDAIAAFGWDYASQSYTPVTNLSIKRAYWVLFLSASSAEVIGVPVQNHSTDYATAGWEMVGSISQSSSVETTPPGSIVAMFKWDTANQAYVPVPSFDVEPQEGYWVLMFSIPATMTVGSSTNSAPTLGKGGRLNHIELQAANFASMPPPPPAVIGGIASVQDVRLPATSKLHQNYPNPFNPETRILFEIPETSRVRLTVYNLIGQEIRTLISEVRTAGSHTVVWDGLDNAGQEVASGLYVYEIMAGSYADRKSLTLLR